MFIAVLSIITENGKHTCDMMRMALSLCDLPIKILWLSLIMKKNIRKSPNSVKY